MAKDIQALEANKNWQVTVRDADGKLVVVMRGQPDAEFKGKYYLYNEDWSPYQYLQGMTSCSLDQIQAMFATGEFDLVRGTDPKE
jgi:hypothetical protein